MISLNEARTHAMESIRVSPPVPTPLNQAHGLFLAETILASRSLPPFDNSAMDGYAVRSEDTRGANRDRPARLKLVQTIFAGAAPSRQVGRREAARIFTGAPIPEGADCVVRQEAAGDKDAEVLVFIEESPGSNVRRRGEEVEEGTAIFGPGLRLDAHAIGVLASFGMAEVPVRPRPKVAILTLGDELVPPGARIGPNQVYDCNGPLIAGLCAEAGAEVVVLEHAADREKEVEAALQTLSGVADLLITSGGASVGDKDLVKRILARLGARSIFDGVAMKPGKPAAVAIYRDTPIAILPGNPGAATVAFDQFARPMLLKRQGAVESRRRLQARLDRAQHKQGGLAYLVSCKVDHQPDGSIWAKLRPQGSGQILQNVGADGWAMLPPGRAQFAAGDEVTVELFSCSQFSGV
jgi:molybdopterin molybdotransferase